MIPFQKFSMKCTTLILSFVLAGVSLTAQRNKVTGRVLNAATKEPIHFASVFFAGTALGTTTREDGTFSFQGFLDGRYDLTVTFIGFQKYQATLDFSSTEFRYEIMLQERPVLLEEILIKNESSDWKRNFADFKKSFLGTTRNSRKCVIINPRGLHFYLDPTTRIFVAHTKEPLIIENRALGYRITYFLDLFEHHKKEGTVHTFGTPKFEPLKPKNINDQKLWAANRREAYSGSIMHFFRALSRNELQENGFGVRAIYEVADPNADGDQKRFEFDSLMRGNLWSKPGFTDSIAGEFLQGSELFESGNPGKICYKGKLAVVFRNEKEEPGYVLHVDKGKREMQSSKIKFLEEGMVIYPNGSAENAKGIMVDGYWSWSETMSDMLPFDYEEALLIN
jgi:hypothetical protein